MEDVFAILTFLRRRWALELRPRSQLVPEGSQGVRGMPRPKTALPPLSYSVKLNDPPGLNIETLTSTKRLLDDRAGTAIVIHEG